MQVALLKQDAAAMVALWSVKHASFNRHCQVLPACPRYNMVHDSLGLHECDSSPHKWHLSRFSSFCTIRPRDPTVVLSYLPGCAHMNRRSHASLPRGTSRVHPCEWPARRQLISHQSPRCVKLFRNNPYLSLLAVLVMRTDINQNRNSALWECWY